jgi:hypothetical protein
MFSRTKTACFLLMSRQLQIFVSGLQGNNARRGLRAGLFNFIQFQENTDSC